MRLGKIMENGTFWCIFARLCAFLCVSVLFFLPKWAAKKHKFAQNCAEMLKKRFYATPPLVIPPFVCHRIVELRLQSLAICDFEVAAIRVTKVTKKP